jgi:hypothetical protein
VQILVVVASIQMRTLKAEVEKGSVRTAFGHGLVDPKALRNCVQKVFAGWFACRPVADWCEPLYKSRRRPKGNQVNIPEPKPWIIGGCSKEVAGFLKKSFLLALQNAGGEEGSMASADT